MVKQPFVCYSALMKLHEQVRQARIDRGLSQLKLSQLSGVPRSQLRIFENGGNITLQTFARLASHLPNLGSVSMGPVELELRHADLVVLRGAMLEVAEAAMRAVAMLDAAVAGRREPDDAGAAGELAADEIERIRQLEPIARAAIALNEDVLPDAPAAEDQSGEGAPDSRPGHHPRTAS